MNLTIDIGNTRVKTGLFDKGKLIKSNSYDSFTLDSLKAIFKENKNIENSILCAVKSYPIAWNKFLSSRTQFIQLNAKTPVPIKIGYKSPATLGMDRLAGACGASSIYKKGNILVVNSGTCITYDFIDSKGAYRGGSISPGLDMRYKALHTFTGKLPLVSPDMKFNKLIGADTTESIKSGVQTGIISEVEGIISQYKTVYKDLIVILTGGNMPWLLKSLKSEIKSEPFLVLTGLNVILSLFQKQGAPVPSNR